MKKKPTYIYKGDDKLVSVKEYKMYPLKKDLEYQIMKNGFYQKRCFELEELNANMMSDLILYKVPGYYEEDVDE